MCASVLCLLHCLFLPWLLAAVGTYLGSMVNSPGFHNFMLVVAFIIGLPVFIISYKRFKSKIILFTGVLGLGLTAHGTIKEDDCCPPIAIEEVTCEGESCCPSEVNTTVVESPEVKVVDEPSEVDEVNLSSFNTIPLGVSLLILAHSLNFYKKRKCKSVCCS